ncbi:IclR family transcriptional regulator [Paenibacillus glycinis]|uniref:Helix-turn-helix domain-containing protein n=1 Tax=Paenibacillus glycinis TaxID=2697035 RepID=A0ABW9XQU5_9BACL|nr:IclR family transcriptional regulator [Paenibacillus glycinis]NBD24764.1 helix-turn-helix domain-containing protein [Paenibacillus glycinis]
MQNKNKTVIRSMDLLNLFLAHTKLSMNDMIRLSGIPKSSVHRMIGSLTDMGLLHRDQDGLYSLGLLFLQFGNLVAERLDIRHVAAPEMQRLRDDIGEAVHLAVRDGDSSMYVEKLDTDHPVRLYTKIGRRAPLYAGASSRILLAFMPKEEQDRYLDEIEPEPIGIGTIVSKPLLREALARSQASGYSFSRSELENYTAELSAPVFDHTGTMVAGLSIAGPEGRFGEDCLPRLIGKVKQAAYDISLKLGYAGPPPLLDSP